MKMILRQRQSGLFIHFADHAFIRSLAFLKLAADADPLAFIEVVFLRGAVQKEVLIVLIFYITKRSIYHARYYSTPPA